MIRLLLLFFVLLMSVTKASEIITQRDGGCIGYISESKSSGLHLVMKSEREGCLRELSKTRINIGGSGTSNLTFVISLGTKSLTDSDLSPAASVALLTLSSVDYQAKLTYNLNQEMADAISDTKHYFAKAEANYRQELELRKQGRALTQRQFNLESQKNRELSQNELERSSERLASLNKIQEESKYPGSLSENHSKDEDQNTLRCQREFEKRGADQDLLKACYLFAKYKRESGVNETITTSRKLRYLQDKLIDPALFDNENKRHLSVTKRYFELSDKRIALKSRNLAMRASYQKHDEWFFASEGAIKVSDILSDSADRAFADKLFDVATHLQQMSLNILDFTLSFVPWVGEFKDVTSAILGRNIITGEIIPEHERTLMLALSAASGAFGAGVVSPSALKYVAGGVGVSAAKISQRIIDCAAMLGVTSSGEISNFVKISQQILKADDTGLFKLEKIIEASKNINPKLGYKYVKELPELQGTFKQAFDGHIFKGKYEPGSILFQAQKVGQRDPGRWFLPIKPLNAEHAEELANIKKWGNNADQIKIYKVKEAVSGYAGKVEGGSGHQFFIPNDVPLTDVIEEVVF